MRPGGHETKCHSLAAVDTAHPSVQDNKGPVTSALLPLPAFQTFLVYQGKQIQGKRVKLKSAAFFLMLTKNKAFNVLQGSYHGCPSSVPDTQPAFG